MHGSGARWRYPALARDRYRICRDSHRACRAGRTTAPRRPMSESATNGARATAPHDLTYLTGRIVRRSVAYDLDMRARALALIAIIACSGSQPKPPLPPPVSDAAIARVDAGDAAQPPLRGSLSARARHVCSLRASDSRRGQGSAAVTSATLVLGADERGRERLATWHHNAGSPIRSKNSQLLQSTRPDSYTHAALLPFCRSCCETRQLLSTVHCIVLSKACGPSCSMGARVPWLHG